MVKPEEADKFKEYIYMLFAGFNRECGTVQAEVFALGCKGIALENVKRGVEKAIDNPAKHPPTVGEFKELCGVRSTAQRTALAWVSLNEAIDKWGRGQSVDFNDRALNATVRSLGGWEQVCDTPEKEFHSFLRNRFDGVYAAFSNASSIGEIGERLIGSHERRNDGQADWKEKTKWEIRLIECESAPKRIEQKRQPAGFIQDLAQTKSISGVG